MSTYNCYWLDHTSTVRHSLLVVAMLTDCPAHPGRPCRAKKDIGTYATTVDADGFPDWVESAQPESHSLEWPKECDRCHSKFTGEAMQSTMQELVYRTADGKDMTLSEAPVGAMWNERAGKKTVTEDGLCIVVKTPGGNWCIDGPSWENGVMKAEHAWTRTGRPPNITANPSIHILTSGLDGSDRRTVYHGWLRDGVLIDA